MAASQNLQAVVNELLLLPDGDDLTHGLFMDTPLYERMGKNMVYLGGATVKVPIQYAKHAVTRTDDPYQSGASSATTMFKPLEFDIWHFIAKDLISEVEIEQSSDAEAANLLKAKVVGMKYAVKDDINAAMLTGDGNSAFGGLPSIWTTTTNYGALARPTKATPGSYSGHIAATAAYDVNGATYGLTEFGGTGDDVEIYETRWDCSGVSVAAAGAADKAELAVMLTNRLFNHITDQSDNAKDMVMVAAPDVYHLFSRFTNSKEGAVKWGGEVSITATGDGGLKFNGITVLKDKGMVAGELFILNMKFLHWGSVDGFVPKKIDPLVEKRPDLIRQQQISSMISLVFLCTNGTRQGWLQGLNSLAD